MQAVEKNGGGSGSCAKVSRVFVYFATQVLVGSLELVIFERMEPRHRSEFDRILRRAGYHAEKKPMLLESHLYALRCVESKARHCGYSGSVGAQRCCVVCSSAGFMWTSVKVHDGEFVHINKVQRLDVIWWSDAESGFFAVVDRVLLCYLWYQGRMHFWRVVPKSSSVRSLPNEPCVFLSWEWVYQGVSQRGISNECWVRTLSPCAYKSLSRRCAKLWFD